jgi:hypothetical protein
MISHNELDRIDLESSRKWEAEKSRPKGFLFYVRWIIRDLAFRILKRT